MTRLLVEFELKNKSLKQAVDSLVEYLDVMVKCGGIQNYTVSIPLDLNTNLIILHAQGYEKEEGKNGVLYAGNTNG